ncbi:MAG: hypothetical protein H6922_01015 [Pseudomonadaceae bacterium]|nr:hypothetical protein [Pseudomonadaceae bacterium]
MLKRLTTFLRPAAPENPLDQAIAALQSRCVMLPPTAEATTTPTTRAERIIAQSNHIFAKVDALAQETKNTRQRITELTKQINDLLGKGTR